MLSEATISSVAKCPRCGYDLRGTIAAWNEACPLSGTCTECGLDFEWAEVLSEKVRRPRWCVEYAERWWHVPWLSVKTLAMTFWPWRFWKSLKMSHEPRWGRFAAYVCLLLVVLYIVFAIGHGMVGWREWTINKGGIWVVQYVRVDERGSTRSQQTPYVSGASPIWTVAQAIVAPWSHSPPGRLTPTTAPTAQNPRGIQILHVNPLPTGGAPPLPATVPHPSPVELFSRYHSYFVNSLLSVEMRRGVLPTTATVLVRLCGFPVLVSLLCVPFFALLPATRRKAKVRWAHVIRIGCYGAGLLVLPIGFSIVGSVYRYFSEASPDVFFQRLALLAFFLMPALIVVWWWQATDRYLHMPHAFGVALAAVFTSGLMVLVCGYFWFATRLWVALG